MADFERAASVADLRPGAGIEVVVRDRMLVLWSVGDAVYATSARCPHRGAPLATGYLDGRVVICASHGWAFDLAGVEPATGEDIERFEVRIENGEVFVRIPWSEEERPL